MSEEGSMVDCSLSSWSLLWFVVINSDIVSPSERRKHSIFHVERMSAPGGLQRLCREELNGGPLLAAVRVSTVLRHHKCEVLAL